MPAPGRTTARNSSPGHTGTTPKRQVARTSRGGPPIPKKHTNLPHVDIEMTPHNTDFDITRFKNMTHTEEMPHGAIDIHCNNNMVSALFDINIGELQRFEKYDSVQMRRQLSEPFKIGELWWMLGIEKELHSEPDLDCSDNVMDATNTDKNDCDDSDDEPMIDIVVHLFCLSIECDFDQGHGYPILMPIRRGENMFSAESGLTFGNPTSFVRLPGSINFFIESGRSNGARTIILGGGNGLIMDGKQHYPLHATVLEDHHDYVPVVNSTAIKVGVEFVEGIPTISESLEEKDDRKRSAAKNEIDVNIDEAKSKEDGTTKKSRNETHNQYEM